MVGGIVGGVCAILVALLLMLVYYKHSTRVLYPEFGRTYEGNETILVCRESCAVTLIEWRFVKMPSTDHSVSIRNEIQLEILMIRTSGIESSNFEQAVE